MKKAENYIYGFESYRMALLAMANLGELLHFILIKKDLDEDMTDAIKRVLSLIKEQQKQIDELISICKSLSEENDSLKKELKKRKWWKIW